MAKEFSLPDLGSGLQEGQIVKWLVEVGQSVTTADDLCEVETEKAVIEIPVPFTGIVAELTAPVGEPVAVGSVIAKFDAEGDDNKLSPAKSVEPKAEAKPVAKPAVSSVARSGGERVRCATPVRKLARENGVDIEIIEGTGRLGRVTRSDVMAVIKGAKKGAATSTGKASSPAQKASIPGTFEKFSMIRRTISDNMSLTKLVDTLMDLLPRAVNRKATPKELTGATFTVNNIGAAGRLMGTSIIPLGTTGILSVGRASEKPIAKNGMIGIAPIMEVTLSFDHRAIDGGLSQKFMADIADFLETPGEYLR